MVSRISSVGLNLAVFSSFSFKASDVAVSDVEWLKISANALLRAVFDAGLAGIRSFTVILPVVRVPVLSRAIQSTLARVSIE